MQIRDDGDNMFRRGLFIVHLRLSLTPHPHVHNCQGIWMQHDAKPNKWNQVYAPSTRQKKESLCRGTRISASMVAHIWPRTAKLRAWWRVTLSSPWTHRCHPPVFQRYPKVALVTPGCFHQKLPCCFLSRVASIKHAVSWCLIYFSCITLEILGNYSMCLANGSK